MGPRLWHGQKTKNTNCLEMSQVHINNDEVVERHWPEVLKQVRALIKEKNDAKTDSECYDKVFASNRTLLHDQFQRYARSIQELWNRRNNGNGSDNKNNVDDPSSQNNNNKGKAGSLWKGLVVETRAALRIGLILSSLDGPLREKIQAEAITKVAAWDRPISVILGCREGDSKCRTLASQLLSNLVTRNRRTASEISTRVPLSPTSDTIVSKVRSVLFRQGGDKDGDDDSKENNSDDRDNGIIRSNNDNNNKEEEAVIGTTDATTPVSWVDMILSCARSFNREALAGVVAALHNCLASLDTTTTDDAAKEFAKKIASDPLLVSTLLRQAISVESIQKRLQQQKQQQKEETNNSDPTLSPTTDDSGTEWISLLVGKLCRMGMLTELFSSASGKQNPATSSLRSTQTPPPPPPPPSTTTVSEKNRRTDFVIVPEHIVLLYFIRTETDNAFDESSAESRVDKNIVCHPLGGEIGESCIVSMHVSLANLFHEIRLSLSDDDGVGGSSSILLLKKTQEDIIMETTTTTPNFYNNDNGDNDDSSSSSSSRMLRQSALLPILHVLSAGLGIDTPYASLIRIELGKGESNNNMLRFLILELGGIVDAFAFKMLGRKARDMTMTPEEQEIIVVLVCFIGNMCYRCRPNQDLLRTTLVPLSTTTASTTKNPASLESMRSPAMASPPLASESSLPATTAAAVEEEQRNGLHLLLSCTAFSPSCFTLREWAIVAIRNALEGNEQNQAEVARLEAQQPVQTAELQDMGIRVDMDPKGNVSVKPLPDEPPPPPQKKN